MKPKMVISFTALLLATSAVNALINRETMSVATAMGSSQVSEIRFDTGDSFLSQNQKQDIADAVARARQEGNVDSVKVLAWSDKEYPARHSRYDKSDIELADRRLDETKNYLNASLDVKTVKTFNMAERPSKLQKMFGTTDVQVKQLAEAKGAAPTTPDASGLFGLKGQSSKVLVMVFLKGYDSPQK